MADEYNEELSEKELKAQKKAEKEAKRTEDGENLAEASMAVGNVLSATPIAPVGQAIKFVAGNLNNLTGGELMKDAATLSKLAPGTNSLAKGMNKTGVSKAINTAGSIADFAKKNSSGSDSAKVPDKDNASSAINNSHTKDSGKDPNTIDSKENKADVNKDHSDSGESSESTKKSKKGFISSIGGGLYKFIRNGGLVLALAGPILGAFVALVVAFVVIGQIMIVVENIESIALKVDTGIEKFLNLYQGEGWMTNEESFFKILDKEYESFPYTGGDKLDIPLIASTIHYSVTTDLEQFEEEDGMVTDIDIENPKSSNFFEMINSSILDGKQTTFFYDVAKDKLGSSYPTFWGGKRLLGYAVKTDITIDTYTSAEWEVALGEWMELFNLYQQPITNVMGEAFWKGSILTLAELTAPGFGLPIVAAFEFASIYRGMEAWLYENGSVLAGFDYDLRNQYYEVQEFVYLFGNLFEKTKNVKKDDTPASEDEGFAWIVAPNVSRTMNYGYDEYKQMKQDLLKMRAILSTSGVTFSTDEEVLEHARNSSNSELKKLIEDYEKNNAVYMFSYTHYLKNVYIPLTYFYQKEYSELQVDIIVDEIYEQRDFYYYLLGEDNNTSNCGGSCTYTVDGKNITDLKVRLLQCADGTRGEPIAGEELVDFEKYILGVVYAEVGASAPVETLKAQAIAARNYALLRPKKMGNAAGLKLENENGQWILSIRNCVEDQVYCDPDKGCSSNSKPTGYNSVTMYSGSNTKPNTYKGPLADDSPVRTVVSEVSGKVLLDENENIVYTTYTNTNQNKWSKQAKEGMDYTEILLDEYEKGRTISEGNCSRVCNKATGDFTQWKQGSGSPWSTIIIGNDKTIGQVGCLVTSVAIQIARSGVPLQNINGEFNPGTFVEALKVNGGFVGANFYWHKTTVVAPTFKYQDSLAVYLKGSTKAQKAQKIQNLINEGCYVVLEVKSGCKGQHWVAVDYVDGNEVYMMDPASTETVVWDKYNQACTTQARCYKVVN